jgi:putative hydrolase of the HAD superfamily
LDLDGVLIDFGDTLAYFREGGFRMYEEALLAIFREHKYQGSFKHMHRIFRELISGSSSGEFGSLHEFWGLFLEKLSINDKSGTPIRKLEEARIHYSPKIFDLYEGTFQVLSTLQKKYHLALVSNCAIGTSDVIKALDLKKFFELIVLSYEVGVRKPDRRIYLEALHGLKLEPEKCIFVADEISDLEGARGVGLKTLLVKQGSLTTHDAEDPDFNPDFQCRHIAEITEFL